MVGTVERDRIELSATFAEPISKHHVREGDTVAAGTLLTEQASPRLDAQQRRAQAERDRSAARLAELIRGPRQEQIREAIARLDRMQAGRTETELQYKRLVDLKGRDFASQAQLDDARARLDSARASLAEARATLDALTAGTTREEIEQARAALQAADAQVEEIGENRARLNHAAPSAAQVESLPYEEGEIPAVGTPVAVLLRAGAPYARVYVPEPLRASVTPGAVLDVHVDGVERSFEARVRYVSAEASFTPYFALTRYDRSRLSFVAEADLSAGAALPAGLPLEATLRSAAGD
jgi:HlyD family secretion protein